MDAARALGMSPGEPFNRLKRGESVTAPDGSIVTPAQVIGPDRKGRTLAIVGPTLDSSAFVAKAGSAELLVHSMELPAGAQGGAAAPGGAAAMAGAAAAALGAKELILWQPLTSFLSTPEAEDPQFPLRVLQQAREAAGPGLEGVSLGGSFFVHSFERGYG